MVKKSKGTPKGSKGNKGKTGSVIPPESWTGYPAKKKCNCPATTLGKAAGGGKSAS